MDAGRQEAAPAPFDVHGIAAAIYVGYFRATIVASRWKPASSTRLGAQSQVIHGQPAAMAASGLVRH